MSSIDEVSSVLGKLTAMTEHMSNKIDIVVNKQDSHHEQLVRTKISNEAAHARLDAEQKKMEFIHSKVEFLDNVYQRAVAIASVISISISAVVGVLLKMFL